MIYEMNLERHRNLSHMEGRNINIEAAVREASVRVFSRISVWLELSVCPNGSVKLSAKTCS